MNGHVLVIGAMLLDTKGKPTTGLEPNTSNPAEIRNTRGGTARNVAENLGLLGADVVLISAVGDDISGRRLLAQTTAANVNTEHVVVVEDANTGSYLAILNGDGSLAVALNDTRVMMNLTPDYLYRKRQLFRDAVLIFFDGSLSPHTIQVLLFLAEQYNIPICADPASTRLAYKLHPHLEQLVLAVPNEAEAVQLCQVDVSAEEYVNDRGLKLARQLHQRGVELAVVTLPDFGFAYASSHESGYLPAHYHEVVDATGTGDAISSAIIFGLMEALPVVECLRLGVAAAGLTLQSAETVRPNLTLDLLYDHLFV
ncbi:MAG: carbohydrate kinase family protein [Candidatus Promineifilaceae bacterium]